MSWNPRFAVRLTDPADRGAAIRTARRLARACQMQCCRATTTDAAFAAAALAVYPVSAAIAIESFEPFALPLPVLRDAATSAELQVAFETPRPPLSLTLTRDAAGNPVTRLVMYRGPLPVTGPALEQCVALVRRAGMLAVATDASAPGLDLASEQVEVPVYADAFPLLASELLDACAGSFFRFEAAVGPEHAAALVASAPADVSITLHVPPHDEAAFAALDRDGAPDLVVTWDEPDHEIWIPAEHLHGGRSDDGRVYTVTLNWAPPPSLVVDTIIDHAGVQSVEAWLAERAGAPSAYLAPRRGS